MTRPDVHEDYEPTSDVSGSCLTEDAFYEDTFGDDED